MTQQGKWSFIDAARSLGFVADEDDEDPVIKTEVKDEEFCEDTASDIEYDHRQLIDRANEGDIGVFEEQSVSSGSDTEDPLDDGDHHGPFPFQEQPFPLRHQLHNDLNPDRAVLTDPANPGEAFLLFYTEEMLRTAWRHTNSTVKDIRRESGKNVTSVNRDFDFDEFVALYAVIIRAGLDHDNFTSLERLWIPADSRPFYRIITSKNRFKFFLRCLSFDDCRDRQGRQTSDPLAAIREMWTMFNSQLSKVYSPGRSLVVGEQLVGYRGQMPGRTYMSSKPRKYGIKFFWICESETGFALKGLIYPGREQGAPRRNFVKDVVVGLAEPFFGTGREIATDKHFTSYDLALELLRNNLSLLGRIVSNRKEVPPCMRSTQGRPVHSSKIMYDQENKMLLLSYIPRKNRNVLILKSSHAGRGLDEGSDDRPVIIEEFNRAVGGVDAMDMDVERYSCLRKTVRWPLVINYNIINIAVNNAFIVYKHRHNLSRFHFINELTVHLAKPYVKRRFSDLKKSADLIAPAKSLGFDLELPRGTGIQSRDVPRYRNPQRCRFCRKHTRSVCFCCTHPICPSHRRQVKEEYCLDC